jgi:Holliday junction resolvase
LSKKPETAIKNACFKYLESIGGYWIKMSGSPFIRVGVPDIIGIKAGHFYAFEIKTAIGKTTKLQDLNIKLINNCGGTAVVIRSLNEIKAVIA